MDESKGSSIVLFIMFAADRFMERVQIDYFCSLVSMLINTDNSSVTANSENDDALGKPRRSCKT